MEGYGWFANTIFHDKDEAKKQYAIDFWFKPEGDKLTLMDIRVQKGPKQEGDSYVMDTRMPVAWWWLPVQEHPGSAEVTRAWQVMSAIHTYVATHKDADGHLDIKDDKTAKEQLARQVARSARCKFVPPWGSSPLRPAAHARLHEPRRQQLRHSVNSRRPGLATRSWNEDRSDLSGFQEWTRLPRLEVLANPTTGALPLPQ